MVSLDSNKMQRLVSTRFMVFKAVTQPGPANVYDAEVMALEEANIHYDA